MRKLQIMTDTSGIFLDDISEVKAIFWSYDILDVVTTHGRYELQCDNTTQAKAIYEQIVKVLYPEPEGSRTGF